MGHVRKTRIEQTINHCEREALRRLDRSCAAHGVETKGSISL